MGGAPRIFVNQPGTEIDVAECGSEEDIRGRSPTEKIAGNLRRFSDAPLSGSGIVVLIAGVSLAVTLNRWRAFGWLSVLGQRTLPVYLIHYYPILIITAIMTPFAVALTPLSPVIPIVLTVIAILVSLLVYRLTRRASWLASYNR